VDAVILAGGKSERLRGIVPPYHKPFLVVNGKSMLVYTVEEAEKAGAERIIIVATGDNALPVWQLVGDRPHVRVTLSDSGVGDSVYRGLELCQSERVLTLMSDNIHGPTDVSNVVNADHYGIGVRFVPCDEAYRFTRQFLGRWVEGRNAGMDEFNDSAMIWCGPLMINRDLGLAKLRDQAKIGPLLDDLVPKFTHVPVSSQDIGVPGAVIEVTGG
jgi:hypothetical protein